MPTLNPDDFKIEDDRKDVAAEGDDSKGKDVDRDDPEDEDGIGDDATRDG